MAQRHRHFPRSSIPLSATIEAWILLASIASTICLIQSDLIAVVVAHTTQFGIIGSFIEGFFFTSILTTPPAIVALFKSAAYVPAWELALVGGFGAVCGDLLVFRFVQSRLVEYILRVAFHQRLMRIGARIAAGPLWWVSPLAGAVVIASPLPDEIGLLMMGLSHIRLYQFVPMAFLANATGIYLIALTAQHIR